MDNQQYILDFLEKVRSIAQLGLHFTKDNYDSERYLKLLEFSSQAYSGICNLPEQVVMERFQSELGYITPKVGVNGVIFGDDGKILLERRSDDGLWGIPGGWAENGESPGECIARELLEETGLKVKVHHIIDVFSRQPGDFGQPHTSYHLLYYCERIGGNLQISSESVELGFYDINQIQAWHRDHFQMAQKAVDFFKQLDL